MVFSISPWASTLRYRLYYFPDIRQSSSPARYCSSTPWAAHTASRPHIYISLDWPPHLRESPFDHPTRIYAFWYLTQAGPPSLNFYCSSMHCGHFIHIKCTRNVWHVRCITVTVKRRWNNPSHRPKIRYYTSKMRIAMAFFATIYLRIHDDRDFQISSSH